MHLNINIEMLLLGIQCISNDKILVKIKQVVVL